MSSVQLRRTLIVGAAAWQLASSSLLPDLSSQSSLRAQSRSAGQPGWARTCGDGRVDRVIDAMNDISPWSVCCSDRNRASVSLRAVPGCSGQGLAIDYNLNGPYPAGAEWLIVHRQFDPPLNLTPYTHLRVALRGSVAAAHHNVQIKVIDQANRVDWFVTESVTDLPAWRPIYVDLRSLTCFGTTCYGRAPLDLSQVTRVEIGIARCIRDVGGTLVECEAGSQESNVVLVDELAAVDLRPGAPHRAAAAPPESVTPNATVRAGAAAALRDKQELAGLVPAWYEESAPNYNTYAQAMRILVLAREYQITGDASFRAAAERAIAAMLALQRAAGSTNAGAWFTAYERNGGQFVARDGCTGNESATPDVDRCFWVGNTAWMVIALDRARLVLDSNRSEMNLAIDRAADWIVARMGRLPDVQDVITYGLEGNISAYFALVAARRPVEAQRLGNAIYRDGWDPIEQRMKIGVLPAQLGTAMDTAGSWGVHLLRSLGKAAEARASQAYVASMYRTSSFDGTRDGYGDVEGPWTMTVEFGAQGAEAGIAGAGHVMSEIHALQASDGSFPGSTDDFSGGSAWITTWHGVAPTAWVYLVHAGGLLSLLKASPDIVSQPSSQAVGAGGSVQFAISAVGSTSYQWQLSTDGGSSWNNLSNKFPFSGVTTATLTVTAIAALNGRRFRAVATNAAGSATSQAAILEVNGPSDPRIVLDSPADGSTIAEPFAVAGWSIDRGAGLGTGINAIHVYIYRRNGTLATGFPAAYGFARADVAAAYGSQFTSSGFSQTLHSLSPDTYDLVAYAHSTVTNTFPVSATATFTVKAPQSDPAMTLDGPSSNSTIGRNVTVAGWAIDRGAPSGTGVDTVHVWAFPNDGSAAQFMGVATYGLARPDIGAALGARYTNSGYRLSAVVSPPGVYRIVAFAHSTVANAFNAAVGASNVTVQDTNSNAVLFVDTPGQNTSPTRPFAVSGWAVDSGSTSGTGIDTIHVWAFPTSGAAATFVGVATYGRSRPDIGSLFGNSRFNSSGFTFTVDSSNLAAGSYDLIVFGRSTVTNGFTVARVVRVNVQ